MNEFFRRVICMCDVEDCPYHKKHCCLGEIDIRCLNNSFPLREKRCCKKKNSIKVIGILEKAA